MDATRSFTLAGVVPEVSVNVFVVLIRMASKPFEPSANRLMGLKPPPSAPVMDWQMGRMMGRVTGCSIIFSPD
jgi:hypothetical protein